MVIVPSLYRSLTRPLRWYIEKALKENPQGYVQVIMGELRTSSALSQLLHQNAHIIEQLALRGLDRVVTTVVPLQLEQFEAESRISHLALTEDGDGGRDGVEPEKVTQ